MKNTRRLLASVCAISTLFLGFSMPGCGGDPAVKQQVEAMQAKVAGLEQQLKIARDESAMSQKRLEEMASAMTAQSEAMHRLQARIDAIQVKSLPPAKASAPAVTKKPAKALPTKKKGTAAKKKGH